MAAGSGHKVEKIKSAEDFARVFHVSRETIGRLETYATLLAQWQKAVNLVGPATLDDVWHRHFADSAQLLAHAPEAKTWIDLGSGAGFPGLVVAILLLEHGQGHVTLIESDQRKAAFLREVARRTAAPVDILGMRIETAATQLKIPLADVVTARALAPLDRLLELAHPFFGRHTKGLFLKGQTAEDEIEAAKARWQFDVSVNPSQTDRTGRVVIVSGLAAKPGGRTP